MRPWAQDVEVTGREHLADGPKLVMMNHSSVFDPFLLTVHGGRPIQFLLTEPAMSLRAASHLAAWWGQVPKRKLDSEARAFRTLKAWCRLGGLVGVFPEGQFPWDGHPLPMQPGLAQLIAYLDVPIVTVRLTNGDRLWPPWAKHPRRTKIRIEIDAPVRLPAGQSLASLVAARLFVDPDACARWPAHGEKLAEGLTRFLRYCPACGADKALADSGNDLRCRSCRRNWAVAADNRLIAEGATMTIAQARHAASAHWHQRWHETHHHESLGPVNVLDVSRHRADLLTTDVLHLERWRLRAGGWSLNLQDVLAHTLDWGEVIVLRTARQRLAIRMPHDSRALWSFALDAARQDAVNQAATPKQAAEA
jgi:hypothetical protein